LTLSATLPLDTPIEAKGRVALAVFDPSYVVGFRFGPPDTLELVGAPSTCVWSAPTQTLDAATAARLSNLPMDPRELPPDLKSAVAAANLFVISCT
jgi:hypothetical protein